jgi:two-component system, OmpR family, copper resistance phosphate regulon response regulator CusR
MNILLLTNNTELASFIKTGLEEKNCTVFVAYDTVFGEKFIAEKKCDVIILDFDLVDLDHFELCSKIRNLNLRAHIIILTEKDWIEYNAEAVGCSADDFILKPVNLNELKYRINMFSQRNVETTVVSPSLKFSDLEVDTTAKKIRRNNKEIKLTAREYKLLELLVQNKGRVIDRTEIAEKIWGFNIKAGVNVINVHMNTLRKKIDNGFSPKLIHTLIGLGYVMRVGE